jgi:hypothetical protein
MRQMDAEEIYGRMEAERDGLQTRPAAGGE